MPEDVSDWVEEYAVSRGVDIATVLRSAVEAFKEDTESGVPDLKRMARSQARNTSPTIEQGVGVCPKRLPGLGHVWAGVKASGDSQNPCKHCGTSGRAFFKAATSERAALFSSLRQPASVKKWGKSAGVE